MATRIPTAAMHCNVRQHQEVINRGEKVLDGLFERPDLYPDPSIPKTVFTAQLKEAKDCQAVVKGAGTMATTLRNDAVKILFDSLGELLLFTNLKQKGNAPNLLASGFPLRKEPTPLSIPDAPLIHEIKKGSGENSAKIELVKGQGLKYNQKERLEYIVQMAFASEEERVYDTVFQTKNQYKLIITNLIRGKEVYFRVAALNSKGQSEWSFEKPFIAF